MTEAMKEMIWMGGCASIMAIFGMIAFIGYQRLQKRLK